MKWHPLVKFATFQNSTVCGIIKEPLSLGLAIMIGRNVRDRAVCASVKVAVEAFGMHAPGLGIVGAVDVVGGD